ncbi:hypothetical protein KJ657_01285 [Patescibacteria group bacterium]|nr:hypothetical protein [Patescibacteria group bacterium]MBU1015701.1 hypothetical protein [Patescibacteria group bacterium]MBU1685211.1 hypothetical protein [Patescibacteria group bacterium]MBU1939054.1 hypothetical protein [Patescibacteria group bacterium]
MFKVISTEKILKFILQQRALRVTILLCVVFVIISITLFVVNSSYHGKITSNEEQIQDAQTQLTELRKTIGNEQEEIDQKIMGRTFAPYDEIVPYISLLESLFAIIDNESDITIKSEEKQILINRFADYEVKLKPGDKFDLFLKALDELYKSKYLIKITSFNINYSPQQEDHGNLIDDASLNIRLYFE